MAVILNIETSADSCSVAVSKDGETIAQMQSEESRSHANVLTVLIGDLLARFSFTIGSLDAIAVSKGPGSYTGLRIGVSVAKGLCFGSKKPLIAINTLQSMMEGLKGTTDFGTSFDSGTWFCPMLDARRQEVYMAMYAKDGTGIKETSAEIITEESFAEILDTRKIVFFGSGAEKVKSIIKNPNAVFVENFDLNARYLAGLSYEAYVNKQFEDIAYFEPLYLKDFVATVAKRKVI